MRSVRLFRNDNVIRALRPFWDSSKGQKFGDTSRVSKTPDEFRPDPYEGNFTFTECDQHTKVTVIGAAGRVGRTLSLLLKTCPLVDHLCLFDTDKAVKGIGVDISHVDTNCCVSHICGMRNIQQALDGPDVVIIAAGCPTSPQLKGKKLFDKNAPIIAGLSEACARFCPKACVVLITSPINSLLPVMGEVYQIITNRIPRRKLFGLTTLDVVRANTFVGEVIRKDPNSIIVPVVGGTSQDTIVPVFSQMKPCYKIKKGEIIALTECLKRAEGNLADCQNCGTRGASSLSTAYAAFRFTSSLVMALKGAENIIECAYVKSDVIPELEYLASPLKLGIRGVEYNFGYPHLSEREVNKTNQQQVSENKITTHKEDEGSDTANHPSGDWIHRHTSHLLHGHQSRRHYHTIKQDDRNFEDFNLRAARSEKFKTYLTDDRKKTFAPKDKFVVPKLDSDTFVKSMADRPSPWDLKFEQTHYKLLNATAKQKFRNFNVQKRLPPSATVLFHLDMKRRERAGKNSALIVRQDQNKDSKETRRKEEGSTSRREVEYEEDEEEDDYEEGDMSSADKNDPRKHCEGKLMSVKSTRKKTPKNPNKKIQHLDQREEILQQLQTLQKENAELKRKLRETTKDRHMETALQVQTDNLELERTKLKACWLIMSSTMEAFSNFCRKFTSKEDASIPLKSTVEKEEETEEDITESEDSCKSSEPKTAGESDKYYRFLESLMQDQIEGVLFDGEGQRTVKKRKFKKKKKIHPSRIRRKIKRREGVSAVIGKAEHGLENTVIIDK